MTKRDSVRVRFANSLRRDLYKALQAKSDESGVPISKLLDLAVEESLGARKITINDNLYNYLCVYFGTKGLDVDRQIEKVLIGFVEKQKEMIDDIIKSLKEDVTNN